MNIVIDSRPGVPEPCCSLTLELYLERDSTRLHAVTRYCMPVLPVGGLVQSRQFELLVIRFRSLALAVHWHDHEARVAAHFLIPLAPCDPVGNQHYRNERYMIWNSWLPSITHRLFLTPKADALLETRWRLNLNVSWPHLVEY